jgi:hypothetical protein
VYEGFACYCLVKVCMTGFGSDYLGCITTIYGARESLVWKGYLAQIETKWSVFMF